MARVITASAFYFALTAIGFGQMQWRSQHDAVTQPQASPVQPAGGALPPSSILPASHGTITKFTEGISTLPRDAGQVWREYDISPYTSRVGASENPQQAVVDWVLRETGADVWFNAPLGILSADKNTLRVYHTPKMQQTVGGIVDRLVGSKGEPYTFNVRLVTIVNPNWRTVGMKYLEPVSVQTPGVEAWLLAKEDAAVLFAELKKRNDYKVHAAPSLVINNGQNAEVAMRRPKTFVRTIRVNPNVWPGYEVLPGQVDEGFSMELSPLLSLDGLSTDAVIRCNVDQVEKIVPVSVLVPTANGGQQNQEIQVPQVVSWRLHERFRWPTNRVLLISAGVVATPDSGKTNGGFRIPNLFDVGPARADGLLFVECKGKSSEVLAAPPATSTSPPPTPRTANAVDTRDRY
jgi:hypothetical protein